MKLALSPFVLALLLGLPPVALAAPRYPCGEMHRTVDVGAGPLCAMPRPSRPGALRIEPPAHDPLVDLRVAGR
jgi:hypothetical protein